MAAPVCLSWQRLPANFRPGEVKSQRATAGSQGDGLEWPHLDRTFPDKTVLILNHGSFPKGVIPGCSIKTLRGPTPIQQSPMVAFKGIPIPRFIPNIRNGHSLLSISKFKGKQVSLLIFARSSTRAPFCSVVYFSRGTLPKKKVKGCKRAPIAGGPRLRPPPHPASFSSRRITRMHPAGPPGHPEAFHIWVWLKMKRSEGQTAAFGPCFHLPEFHFGTGCLCHSHFRLP